jgi:hypothetical protein
LMLRRFFSPERERSNRYSSGGGSDAIRLAHPSAGTCCA